MRKLKQFTDEERAEFKRQRFERRDKLTLAYQLGFYIGEQIVSKFLPTLSVDGIHTNKNISVTCAEGDECRRLNDVWFNKHGFGQSKDSGEDSNEWKELRAYHEMLEEKYLPKMIECYFPLLNIGEHNMNDFKKGISISLWDCDASHYSTSVEDIEVRDDENGWNTFIILKRV